MRRFGESLGIAFQIRDDIFDYQYNGIVGKPAGNDLKEKKLTLPVIYTLSQSSPAERIKLRSTIRRAGKDRRAIKEIIDLINNKGGIDYASTVMKEYKQKALAILNDFPDNEARNSLMQLVEYAIERKK